MNCEPAAVPQQAALGGEKSPPVLSDEERERLIKAYWQIITLEPDREVKRLAQQLMGSWIMRRPQVYIDALETKLFGKPLR